ncbi:MAG: homocysteine S-methyltransferase family protein [Candidatus Margulisiibacteriota bacterium]|nr:homocysteine S-methyltransferase family protein [Candidatus Margulisiibacteriota bacterium]
MNKFLEALNKKILVMDGAMGTRLMEGGVRPEDCFDAQNLKNPNLVESIQRAYVKAGADILETNTFGANHIKLADYKLDKKVREINIAAAKIARRAIGSKGFVCGSIGPLGKMLDPLGEISFDQAYNAFAEQARALEAGGVDVICVETISDLQEMRAAVIAAKNETKLPVIASLTYDDGEKTIYGTSAEVAVVVLEALGVDIISANCSTGPEGMLDVAKKLLAVSSKPIMVMPNAGMPELEGNKAIYKMTPKKFGEFAVKFAKLGVSIVGGCCGTGPLHIEAVKKTLTPYLLLPKGEGEQEGVRVGSCFASRSRVVELEEGKPLLVAERINPTGRRIFREELQSMKTQIIRTEAVSQSKAKADLLDVNISVPDINEVEMMHEAVKITQSVSDLPLSIDNPHHSALETGLKMFCGKALLNSVNGKQESMDRNLPLAKRYGAAIIALALDETGIPKSASDRLRIAQKIVHAAHDAGISSNDIYVDNLVMTAGVGIGGCLEALKAIPIIKENLGVKTILGISNVSHGMPNRSKLNALYLRLAVAYGLDAAIVDPTDPEMKKVFKAKPLSREKLVQLFKDAVNEAKSSGKPAEKKREATVEELKYKSFKDVEDAVIDGNSDGVKILVDQALVKKVNPQKIIDQGLVPGMEVVGKKFSRKEYFLPQVIESAEAMRTGFVLCKEKIPKGKAKSAGKVVLATVKGDVHDIGKNILKMLLENHGFKIVDLGKDIPPGEIVKAAKKEKPNVIALSALLTTTMVEMGVVKDELEKAKLNIPLLVGGAVVTKGYADRIGANYSMDAVGAVALAKKIIKAARK